MSDQISESQISLLREVMCLLTCHRCDNLDLEIGQALRCLGETLHLEAAGLYWREDSQLMLRVQWPEDVLLNGPAQKAITNQDNLDEIIEGNGEVAWLAVPMRSEGVTRGRLAVIARPDRVLSHEERELLLLAANQLALARQNALLCCELATLAERRGELLRRLIEADEQCSRRVSRELHDEISQSLTALMVEVDTILVTNLNNAASIKSRLDHLRRKLVQVTDEVNRIVLDLRPTLLENNGLMAALGWYGTERLRLIGTRLHIAGGQCVPELSPCLTTMLYRIGQEALANVARHAQANNVWLDITCQDNQLTLTIDDDGCGFEAARILKQPQGLQGIGLMGMQERAILIDGELTVESTVGQGTHVRVRTLLNENKVTNGKNQNPASRRPCGSS